MKSLSYYLQKAILIISLYLIVGAAIHASPLPTSITLTTHDLAPYGSYQVDGSFKGAAHNVVQCALDSLSISLSLKVVPWNRAQLEVREGLADGFYAGSQNDVRDEYAVKSAEVADQIWRWYLNKDSSWDPKTPEFKQSASVSSFLGANMQKWLVDQNYHIGANPIDTKRLLDMLLLGRIDAALANNYVMDDLIEKRGIANRIRTSDLKSKPLHVYFSKAFINKYASFLYAFNKSASQCKNHR